jgi:sulfite exporter TauE/SafE
MVNVFVAFITGLTTGGLSCLAVQGGLLASSMARQIELDLQGRPSPRKSKTQAPKPRAARPIVLFLLAKLAAYTLLGLLLGAVGSVLQLNALTRAILLLAIGIFMIGNGLRMLNVHPIFRYFAIEPPAALTRYIRRKAKNGASDDTTPLFLGALTVFIPCGVTQAMMAVAIGTGSPLEGAAILFAFVLGTSPVFFGVAYLAARLGSRLEANFMRFVAVIVLILGIVTIESGLNLMGSPYSLSKTARAIFPAAAPASVSNQKQPTGIQAAGPAAPPAPSTDTALTIEARNDGYAPVSLQAKAGVPITLKLVTQNTRSCSRSFVIPALSIEQLLPLTGAVKFDIPPQPKGSVLQFTCSMGMYGGEITFQ